VSCRSLGADLPPTALMTAIRRTAPAAVLLWSQMSSTADLQVLRSLPRTRPGYRSFVAGPGWAEVELPPQIGRLESLEEATDALSAAATV
jgi:MerR family transcriptional regulator, light-induced transcriptional regulator